MQEVGSFIEKMLEDIAQGNQEPLHKASQVVRASLKLDAYEFSKVHGEVTELSTRLIYSSCYIRNSVIRAFMASTRSFSRRMRR